jgi:hypothetical protein
MSPNMAAKLLTLLTLAEVLRKIRDLAGLGLAHSDMREFLNCFPDAHPDLLKLLNQAEVWRQKKTFEYEEVARCHADMRALLEGCVN